MARVIESGQFQNEVADGVIIVDFFATWCGPCKMLSPVFEELGLEMEGKVKFIKIDVDKSPDIASKYSVSTIPTMLILKNGEKQDAMVGFLPKEVIKEKIEKYLWEIDVNGETEDEVYKFLKKEAPWCFFKS